MSMMELLNVGMISRETCEVRGNLVSKYEISP